MFFFLSKILDFLLSPLVWVILLFLLGFLVKNRAYKKRLFYTGVILLVVFSNPFLADQAFKAWEGKPVPMKSIKNYEMGIVLTGVAFNRKEAPDRVFFSKGADRVLHPVQLYKAGKIKKILISGGSGAIIGKRIPEAQQLRKVFLYSGVPDSVIIIEDRSRNTAESARYTKLIIDRLTPASEYLLITSAFHMPRSLGSFRKVGMDVDPYSVDFYTDDQEYDFDDLIIPTEYAMNKWSVLIHEVCGYGVYKMMGYS